MSILSRRARVKELSNKAEGIFQYVGTDNVLFRLISTGNELTNQLPDTVTRSTIDSIYRRVGKLLCLVDIIHAAAGEQIMPEPYDSIDFCYMMEYREMLHEAVIRGMPDNYKGVYQNPYRIKLAKPAIAYEINGRFDPDEFDDGEFASFTQEEEARDRKIVFHCTKSELDAIMRFANVIEVKVVEEDIHHA